jgi:DNA-binding transcriptional MerR regulator/methylmalonyl-CoA mutase cobalamin-binding subunit
MLTSDLRIQPPQLDAFADTPFFNTKAVVRQTSVPAPTLRAWERRYGILSPQRAENDYRLYSERDMAIIAWLRERVEQGMTISQAVAMLRSSDALAHRARYDAPAGTPDAEFSWPELQAALLDHFVELDEAGASAIINQALAVYSVEDVCLLLFVPTLTAIGDHWSVGDISITIEHFASTIVRGSLERLFHLAAIPQAAPLILVGCAPEEQHELGALMLALFLRRAGAQVAYLGQNVEPADLAFTVASARPAAVALSATLPQHAALLAKTVDRVRQAKEATPKIFVGGQAFAADPGLIGRVNGALLQQNALNAAYEIRSLLPA